MSVEGSRATTVLEAVSEEPITVFAAAVDSDQKSRITDEMKKRAPLKKIAWILWVGCHTNRGTRHTVQTDGRDTITQAPQKEWWSVHRNLYNNKKQMEWESEGDIMFESEPWAIFEWIQNPASLLQDEW